VGADKAYGTKDIVNQILANNAVPPVWLKRNTQPSMPTLIILTAAPCRASPRALYTRSSDGSSQKTDKRHMMYGIGCMPNTRHRGVTKVQGFLICRCRGPQPGPDEKSSGQTRPESRKTSKGRYSSNLRELITEFNLTLLRHLR
jgi:hypothetical protein